MLIPVRHIFFFLCFVFVNVCKGQIKPAKAGSPKQIPDNKTQSSLKDKIKGIWTDGNSKNATFDIRDNSIRYVEHFATYKYELSGNTIKIKYPDFVYTSTLSFQKDTLIMTSNGESVKFWKFKK
jgi:hypothetical protein